MDKAEKELRGIVLTDLIIDGPVKREDSLLYKILTWHKRYSSTVPTFDEIAFKVNCWRSGQDEGIPKYNLHGMTNDLQALFQKREAPVWCEHCVVGINGKTWTHYTKTHPCTSIPDHWDICPVKDCHAPRPEVRG